MSVIKAAYPTFFKHLGNPRVAKTWAENSVALSKAHGDVWSSLGRLTYLQLNTIGQRFGQAGRDAAAAQNAFKNIGSVKAATAGGVLILGLECYFMFHIGECLGRFNLIGYPVGPTYPDKH